MPICNDRHICFIHIPKTGGTTIETSLGIKSPCNLYDSKGKVVPNIVTRQHLYGSEIVNELSIDVSNYYIFSVVRNPFDRLVSAYHFVHKNIYIPSKIKLMRFQEFVRYSLNINDIERRYIFDGHLEPQVNYLDIDNVNIFNFESINECFTKLNDKYGPLTFDHILKSNRKPWELYYTSELKEIVYNFYKEDFKRFDYPYNP